MLSDLSCASSITITLKENDKSQQKKNIFLPEIENKSEHGIPVLFEIRIFESFTQKNSISHILKQYEDRLFTTSIIKHEPYNHMGNE